MSLVEIGKTSEGRPMVMAIITSPENLSKLDRYKQISAKRLALAEGLTDAEARKLALRGEGRRLDRRRPPRHRDRRVRSSSSSSSSRWSAATTPRPCAFWTMSSCWPCPSIPTAWSSSPTGICGRRIPLKRSMSGLPRLYQKYVGHDNNRDFYMVTQPETEAVSRQLYIEWHPQFLYNHHQTGPAGTVLFCPPFRDPFNYYFDPLVPIGTDLLGLAMHERFAAEGKPGAIMRSGAGYSTWWNGGLRSTGYFHNIIGILTEIIGNPTPMDIPFIPDRMLPKGDYPFPIMPQKWHFRQSIDYSDHRRQSHPRLRRAAPRGNPLQPLPHGPERHRQGKPRQLDLRAPGRSPSSRRRSRRTGPPQPAAGAGGRRSRRARRRHARRRRRHAKYYDMLRDPAKRDPRGFIIPSDQPDFPTAVKFVNTLIKSGITVHRATKPFAVGGKTYPAGSYVVKSAQAFRAHVISMFEPQDHPNDFAYPGGPPRPPYDSAGWTVAFQMGIKFDRILDGFDGPFEEAPAIRQAAGRAHSRGSPPSRPAFCSAIRSTTPSSPPTGFSRPVRMSIG